MRRFASLSAVALVAAIALSACGGSSKPPAKQASVAGNGIKLAECMRKHGVPSFPDPSGNSGSISVQSADGGQNVTINGVTVSGPAFQAAMQKCQSEMPKGRPVSSAQIAKLKAGALKMAQCMRSHGVPNFPDPQITTGPGGRGIGVKIGGPGAGINPQSPAFQKAQTTCQPLMGGPGSVRVSGAPKGKGSSGPSLSTAGS